MSKTYKNLLKDGDIFWPWMIINLSGLFVIWILKKLLFVTSMRLFLLVSAFMLFTPIILIFFLIGSLSVLSVWSFINFRKNIKNHKISAKSKNIFSTVIFLNLLIYPLIWILIVCSSGHVRQQKWEKYSQQIRPVVERQLTKRYLKSGFRNFKLKMGKVDDVANEGFSNYTVHYTYIENIKGRKYKSKQEVAVDNNNFKIEDDDFLANVDYKITEDNFGTNSLTADAAFFQPKIAKKFAEEIATFKTCLGKNQKISSITGNYNNIDHNFKKLKKQVQKNRTRKLPVAGYYNLDVKGFGRKGIVYYSSQVIQHHAFKKDEFAAIMNKMRHLDPNKFLPGSYSLEFDYRYDDKDGEQNKYKTIYMSVKNNKINDIELLKDED